MFPGMFEKSFPSVNAHFAEMTFQAYSGIGICEKSRNDLINKKLQEKLWIKSQY